MRKNIFISLAKYRPSKKNTPKENQFTESFSFLLDDNPKLMRYVLKGIFKGNIVPKNIFKKRLIIETQASYKYEEGLQYPDIEVHSRNKEVIIFIENKIDSGIKEKQLWNYMDILKDKAKIEGYASYFLILITKNEKLYDSAILKNKHFLQKRWEDLYTIIYKFKNKEKRDFKKNIIKQFLEYMEDEKMKPFDKFNSQEIGAWPKFNSFKEKAVSIIKIMQDELNKRGYIPSVINRKADYINCRFRPSNIQQRKWDKHGWKYFIVEIALYKDDESDKPSVQCGLCFWMNASFCKNYIKESTVYERVYKKLQRRDFDISNPRFVEKYDLLDEIIRDYRSGKDQKKAIIDFLLNTLKQMEDTGFVSLIKRSLSK